LDPRFAGSKLAEDYGFLRAINISGTTSFGGEVNPVVRSYKILRRVKYPCSMKEILAGKIHGHFSLNFSFLATLSLLVAAESSGG
jgi:hypothetical protein